METKRLDIPRNKVYYISIFNKAIPNIKDSFKTSLTPYSNLIEIKII